MGLSPGRGEEFHICEGLPPDLQFIVGSTQPFVWGLQNSIMLLCVAVMFGGIIVPLTVF